MRNLFLAAAVFVIGFAFVATPAFAQNFEVGAKIGVWGADELDEAAPLNEDNDDTAFTFGLVGQYNINEDFGVRLDIEFGTTDNVDSTSFIISGVYNFMPVAEGHWSPYGRAGLMISNVDLDYTLAPDYDTEFGFEAAVGVNYTFDQFRVFGELGYRLIQFDGDDLEDDLDMSGFVMNIGIMFIF